MRPNERVLKAMRHEPVDRAVFSGGVDENVILSQGTPDEVRAAVRGLIRDMDGLNGGFFLGPTHNLQTDCKTENILAMYEEAALCQ